MEFFFKDYESRGIPQHLVINSMYYLYCNCGFFVTLPTGAILYARVILCALLTICRSKILASEWVFSKFFPLNPPWKWEHMLAFKPASRIRFYCRRNFAAATVNYWQDTVKKTKVIFEKGLFNNFKRENTLFFLKNLLANSSFLLFPKIFFQNLGLFGIIT